MNGIRIHVARDRKALRRTACRCHEMDFQIVLFSCRDDGPHECRFPCARPAGDDEDAALHRLFDGFLLLLCQCDMILSLKFLDGQCSRSERLLVAEHAFQDISRLRLRFIEKIQVHIHRLFIGQRRQKACLDRRLDAFLDDLDGEMEKRHGIFRQRIDRHTAVPLRKRQSQHMRYASCDALAVIRRYALIHCDAVDLEKSHSGYVFQHAIGFVLKDGLDILSVTLLHICRIFFGNRK